MLNNIVYMQVASGVAELPANLTVFGASGLPGSVPAKLRIDSLKLSHVITDKVLSASHTVVWSFFFTTSGLVFGSMDFLLIGSPPEALSVSSNSFVKIPYRNGDFFYMQPGPEEFTTSNF